MLKISNGGSLDKFIVIFFNISPFICLVLLGLIFSFSPFVFFVCLLSFLYFLLILKYRVMYYELYFHQEKKFFFLDGTFKTRLNIKSVDNIRMQPISGLSFYFNLYYIIVYDKKYLILLLGNNFTERFTPTKIISSKMDYINSLVDTSSESLAEDSE